MKKTTAILLAILMIFSVTASGLSAFAAVEVSVEFTDSNPISIADVESAKYTTVYYLHEAEIDYEVMVTMPDGTKQVLNPDVNDASAGSTYYNYGYAYIDFEECEIAKINGSTTVPVHIYVEIRDTASRDKLSDYEFVIYKKLVKSYIKSITPVEGTPTFIYEKSEAVNFSSTRFEVEYWDGRVKTFLAQKTDEIGDKPAYTLDGKPLRYVLNTYDHLIFVSYLDGDCTCEITSVKEFPFESIELVGCTIKGDMPETIEYHIKWKSGKAQTYTATVNSYSGNINHIEGYNVSFSTEGSRFTSTVKVTIGNLSDSESYEVEQENFLQSLLAKLALFLRKVFGAVFPNFNN